VNGFAGKHRDAVLVSFLSFVQTISIIQNLNTMMK